MRDRKDEVTKYLERTLKDKRKSVGFLGLGKSNLALFNVIKDIEGVSITLRDSREGFSSPVSNNRVRLLLGNEYLSDINESILFMSPSLRRDSSPLEDAVKKGVVLSSDCEIFFSENRSELILAVSGSDGKSTVTELTSSLLTASGISSEAIGNIGTPYVSRKSADAYVTELSSFNLEYISPISNRAAITGITPNHLNWHKSFEEYIESKLRILENTERAVLSLDTEPTEKIAKKMCSFAVTSTVKSARDMMEFNAQHRYYLENGFIMRDGQKLICREHLGRNEEYNTRNAMTALALTDGLCDFDRARSVLSSFRGLPHRCELILDKRGIKVYNSSIDTSPLRTAATLSSLGRKVRILLGGQGKGLPFSPMTEWLLKYADRIAVYGAAKEEIFEYLLGEKRLSSIPRGIFDSFSAATEYLLSDMRSGECALLSPACTAYGEFSDFEERGKRFVELANRLIT